LKGLKQYIYNTDSYSVDHIINAINELDIIEATNKNPIDENRLTHAFKRLTRDQYYKYKYSAGYGSQKFPGLKMSEIESALQDLGDASGLNTSEITVEPVTPWSETYWIYSKAQ
jgi:hypothetical protein